MKRLLVLVLLVTALIGCKASPDTSKPWYDDQGKLHNQYHCETVQVVAYYIQIKEGTTKVGFYYEPNYVNIPIYRQQQECSYK